ncbi:hypothetical protein D3C72_202530 [compost metagenome]
MSRPPALRALTLVATGVFALGAVPAQAAVVDIYQGSVSTKREEKRLVNTGRTEEVRGAKQLLGTTPHVDEKILGSASKLVTESEIRSYQIPVTTHPVMQEDKREVWTTTTNYIRRTTTEVIDSQWTVWNLGGYLREGYRFGAVLTQKSPMANGDYKSMSRPVANTGPQEYTLERYNWADAISVDISPHGMYEYLDSHLVFYKSNLAFMGGNIKCHDRWYANVKEAKLIRYSDHDAIQYRLNCYLNEDPWPWTWCETDRTVWTVHLDRKLIASEVKKKTHFETKDEPHSTVSTTTGSWTDTGRRELGAALTNPALRYESLIEKVMMRQVTAVNDAVAAKALARSGNDVRKTFTADSSSGKSQASLSGSKVRQTLGANRVTPSRVNTSKGNGAPDQSGASSANPASPLFPWLLPPNPQPTPKPSPMPVSWWFPMDPQTPPPLVRYETYMNRM